LFFSRIERNAENFAQFGKGGKSRALLVYKHFVPTALLPTESPIRVADDTDMQNAVFVDAFDRGV
jgi:hypothetical protein